MPYRTPNGQIYDSGEFEAVMDEALALADWKGFPARRAASERAGTAARHRALLLPRGRRRHPRRDGGPAFPADGTVALRTGAQAMGQGHLTIFPRSSRAGSASTPRAVRLVQGDSDEVPAGTPSVASRSLMMAGSAAALACDAGHREGPAHRRARVRGRARRREFTAGRFRVEGTDRAIGVLELAVRARALPDSPTISRAASTAARSSSRRR